MKKKVVLASASPRRRELLKLIFDEFTVCVSDVEETVPDGISPCDTPEYLARLKAEDIAKKYPESLVLGADTVVLAGGKILGKPKTQADAFAMLKLLSGRTHKVITGCAAVYEGKTYSFGVRTDVEFFDLTDSEINNYIKTGEPFDKAGGYGIQSKGAVFVKKINGDYYNVVGLPVSALKKFTEKIIPDFASIF